MAGLQSIGLFALAMSVLGGDLNGHAVVTKRLSRKPLAAAPYDLRGVPAPAPAAQDDPGSEFDRMVVVLEGRNAAPKPPDTFVIQQHNTRFEPDLLVVPIGSTVQFPNEDPIFHNVFSLSHAQSFDLGFYPKGQSRSVKFNRAGIVQVYCHIHANMYAAIVVTSSPWYTRPGADGNFSFTDLPAGHYVVNLWHKVAGMFRDEVDVPEHGSADVVIRVPVDVAEKH